MFWGLNKTRCPGLLSLAHMLSAASSSSYLTPQMEARTGQPPLLRPPGVHRLLFRLPLTRPGSRLPVCVPISLSSCLLLFTALSFMLGRPLPPPPPPPQSSCTLVTHTHTHTQRLTKTDTRETSCRDYSTLSPVHPLQVALPVPALMRHTGASKGHTLTLCVL